MGLLSYLGLNNAASQSEKDNPVRPLPSNWYSAPETYELERRAIFTRQWQLATHKSRLQSIGDFVKLEVAGYEFVLSRDRQGKISGFHNVCRHRAYPVVTKDCGTSNIFSCKYHGWSYGLNGKLAKAPGYQELAGFDKEKNGLFPVHVHIDDSGFVWINLESGDTPEISWEDDFGNSDSGRVDGDAYEFDNAWQLEGDNNWKVYAEDYNRRYHVSTSTAEPPPFTDHQVYILDSKTGEIAHESRSTDTQRQNALRIEFTSFLPNASISVSQTFCIVQRFVPTSASRTTIMYQVFRNKSSSKEDFDAAAALFQKMMTDNKEQCDRTRHTLDAEVAINGDTSPNAELTSDFFRNAVREAVETHHAAERAARKEIWPTRQKVPETEGGAQSHEDDAFCASLCPTNNRDELNW